MQGQIGANGGAKKASERGPASRLDAHALPSRVSNAGHRVAGPAQVPGHDRRSG
jgi:hypothetical protein